MSQLPLGRQLGFYARMTLFSLRRAQQNRDTVTVLSEYSDGWAQYRNHLDAAKSLDEWLCIHGVEDVSSYCNVGGRLSYQVFDSARFYRECLLLALRSHFPNAGSITEFGCGVGRNLLFLKREMPGMDCFGYELCQPGVEVARTAAQKFGLSVNYAQLDYVNDSREKYVFPGTDVAFTMFSLEQLPRSNATALEHILDRVKLGSIHIEPVPENYPISLRGILGRIEHQRVDYLSGFDAAVRNIGLQGVTVRKVASAHNPLMFPSLYVLEK